MYVGHLISGSSVFSKPSLYIWKFLFHVLLKPSLKNFEHNFASMWNELNCILLWALPKSYKEVEGNKDHEGEVHDTLESELCHILWW